VLNALIVTATPNLGIVIPLTNNADPKLDLVLYGIDIVLSR